MAESVGEFLIVLRERGADFLRPGASFELSGLGLLEGSSPN